MTNQLKIAGFQAGAIHSGIRKDRNDTAIIYCPEGATWAGCFTTNKVKAAPVQYNQALLNKENQAKVVIVHSGNANACTGEQGKKDTEAIAKACADAFNVAIDEVLVNATGIIGERMPMDKIIPSISELPASLSEDGFELASQAILTTDTVTKTETGIFTIDGQTVGMSAICKGSGMIHPNMGTMLAYIMTDIAIDPSCLQRALKKAVDLSFNLTTVDGDQSTNDSVIALANGQADNAVIQDVSSDAYHQFEDKLIELCQSLAKQIAADGEGATKCVTVHVEGATSDSDAKEIAMSVATSSLVKTAMHGNDANWGRILAAIGYADVEAIDIDHLNISFMSKVGKLCVLENGKSQSYDNEQAIALLDQPEIAIHIEMGMGEGKCQVWTCDFSADYVKINADYRS